MSETVWTAVDHYIDGLLIPADPALEAALDDSKNVGLPSIQVTPAQGKFLHLLARIQGARKILELGTLGGYSTIWLARSLPKDGGLITVEYEPKHAEVARQNILRAGLEALVDIRIGAALEALPKIIAEGAGPFDLIFIDADKKNIPAYFEFALKLSKPGSVIIVDNVVRDGKVIDAATSNPDIQGVRLFNEKLATEPRVSATTLQTVGAKGYDGFTLALVTSAP
ncbi:MAG: O-methyltransferase [Alphaproteobacteria bacterium]|nr:O-methyltransferase [Alphaproteobacteria bacterium]